MSDELSTLSAKDRQELLDKIWHKMVAEEKTAVKDGNDEMPVRLYGTSGIHPLWNILNYRCGSS